MKKEDQFKNFALTKEKGRLIVTWTMAPEEEGKPAKINLITPEMLEELSQIVRYVQNEKEITGVILESGNPDFSAGFDLKFFRSFLSSLEEALSAEEEPQKKERILAEHLAAIQKFSFLLRRVETCGKPWVAVIRGTCVGGGFEIALACHARLAEQTPRVKIALPEVQVGLYPGGGGTQRVMRLCAAQEGLTFLLKGQTISASEAERMNLINALAPADELRAAAHALLDKGVRAERPWDVPQARLPNTEVHSPAGRQFWAMANALYRKSSYDLYPAGRALMQAVFEGVQLPMDTALEVDSRHFFWALRQPSAMAMMRTNFFSAKELGKAPMRPADVSPISFTKIGVVGAGFMGSAIAHVVAAAGVEVILLDKDQAAAEKGKAACQKLLAAPLAQGQISPETYQKVLGRIRPTQNFQDLSGSQLVIEAVDEDLALKKKIFTQIAQTAGSEAILASNTSALSLSEIARRLPNPRRVLGLHFFSPVHRMRLVEVVCAAQTSPEALARSLDFVLLLRKVPILVQDSYGFYVNRVLMGYLREAFAMLEEGVPPTMVEGLSRTAGMPMSPLALIDAVGLEVVLKILQSAPSPRGRRPKAASIVRATEFFSRCLEVLVQTHARLGRKNGKGFYDYPEKGRRRLWAGISDLAGPAKEAEFWNQEQLKQRFLIAQALEAARCFDEEVLTEARQGDVASVLGLGFAPFTGGVISYIDAMGLPDFVKECRELESVYGSRFTPPPLLREMAQKGESFAQRFPASSAA